jgi:hypothetical protein
MTDRELMQMALTHLEHSIGVSDESQKRLSELKKALRDRLAQPEPGPVPYVDLKCKTHPDAPHGFDRNASLSEDRYVCECESWEPPTEPKPVAWADKHDIERDGHDFYVSRQQPAKNGVPLYTAPPKREWVSPTHLEIGNLWAQNQEVYAFAIALDKLLSEKNDD